MRRSLVALSALVMLAATLVTASAQGGPGRRGGFMMGGLALLRRESVQKELKMTQPQIDKLDAKQQEVQQQIQDLFQNSGGFQNMSPEDRQKLFEKVQDIQHKAVVDILDTTQLKRFDQLELQQQGPQALARREVADRLKLTDDQRKQIAGIQQDAQQQQRDLFQNGGGPNASQDDRQKMMEKMRDIQKTAGDKMLALLTDDQKKQWKDMQGEKFDFGPPPGRGPGGGA